MHPSLTDGLEAIANTIRFTAVVLPLKVNLFLEITCSVAFTDWKVFMPQCWLLIGVGHKWNGLWPVPRILIANARLCLEELCLLYPGLSNYSIYHSSWTQFVSWYRPLHQNKVNCAGVLNVLCTLCSITLDLFAVRRSVKATVWSAMNYSSSRLILSGE